MNTIIDHRVLLQGSGALVVVFSMPFTAKASPFAVGITLLPGATDKWQSRGLTSVLPTSPTGFAS
jgi:hypothetical protein